MDDSSPGYRAPAFKCPLCGAYSEQRWLDVKSGDPSGIAVEGKELKIAQCTRCNKLTYWLDGKMLPAASRS